MRLTGWVASPMSYFDPGNLTAVGFICGFVSVERSCQLNNCYNVLLKNVFTIS